MYSTTFPGKSAANVFALKRPTKLKIPRNSTKFTCKIDGLLNVFLNKKDVPNAKSPGDFEFGRPF